MIAWSTAVLAGVYSFCVVNRKNLPHYLYTAKNYCINLFKVDENLSDIVLLTLFIVVSNIEQIVEPE